MAGSVGERSREAKFGLLLLGLLLLLLVGPLIRQYGWWGSPLLLEAVFGTSAILFIISLTRNVRVFLHELIPALLIVMFAVLAVLFRQDIYRTLMLVSALVFCSIAINYSSRAVFLSGAVDLNKIVGSVCVYMLLVVTWAIFYEFLELVSPGSFSGLSDTTDLSRFNEFAYFSLVTITTLGYGDITPNSLLAGIVAGLQATVGVFYTAVLVASLVGDFMARREQLEGRE